MTILIPGRNLATGKTFCVKISGSVYRASTDAVIAYAGEAPNVGRARYCLWVVQNSLAQAVEASDLWQKHTSN